MDIISPWPLMVTKIGKFGDYIVGRAQGTRIGEKHIESNTNPIFLLCFAYKQCKTLLCVSTANIELVRLLRLSLVFLMVLVR